MVNLISLPRTGENGLINLDDGLIPLRDPEIFHHLVRSHQADLASVFCGADKP